MRILRLLSDIWNRFAAQVLLRRGVYMYRNGHFATAAAFLHSSVLRGGPSFVAHLYLGRVYLRLNRFDRARQEFARARFIDPGRFAAEGLPEDLLLEMAEKFCRPERQLDHSKSDREPAQQRSMVQHQVADDFSSSAERDRFRVLPPIRPEDLDNVDWDDLSRLLDQ